MPELEPNNTRKSAPKIGLVSLGCPKATVDSERIISRLRMEGYDIAPSYDGADVVLVNTCGFLNAARAESFDAIAEAMSENGRVIVTGCLGVDEPVLRDKFPNLLAVTGPHQYDAVVSHIHAAAPPPHDPYRDLIPPGGLKLTPRHYAYLKISEGCSNSCSFCIIPHLRGPLKSRPAADVLDEAEQLASAGVKELLVISQDTSAYGRDLHYAESDWQGWPIESRLRPLTEALGDLGVWVRLHYIYPYPHVDNIIPLMSEGYVVPYLDIPFQHASPSVLKAMRRPAAQEKTLARIEAWRRECPDLGIRSTFIVGFPGETDQDFETLLEWLKAARLNRVGCFTYDSIAGAPANALEGQVPEEVKQGRWETLMALQKDISTCLLLDQLGKIMDVIVDEVDEEGAAARSHWDAPEIDGNVFIEDGQNLSPGDIVKVHIHDSSDYDLWGTLAKA